MEELELSIKYGVTTLETSRVLNFPFNEFTHIWVLKDNEWSIELTKYHSKLLPIQEVFAAPQMHEIFPYLEGDGNADFLIDGDTLWYDCNDDEAKEKYGEIQAFIYDNHIAEACAEIYIQLKSKNLLWKSLETNS